MNRIAFILGDLLIYWNSIIMALAILTGIVLFWAAFIRRSENIAGAAVLCPLAVVTSFWLARLIHWYFRADGYESFVVAMTDFSGYGYALSGAFLGCILSAVVLFRMKLIKRLRLTLDCMSIGGSAAIAVGRLACFFTAENHGDIIPGVTGLPLVHPIVNMTSGMVEYRFATFLFQAIVTAMIFAVLLVLFLRSTKLRDGDIFLLFLLMYSASQILLDSTRYDALRLRSNGFISVVQVLGALAVVMTIIVFSVRLCRNRGWNGLYIPLWLLTAAGMGGAAFMEYYVQRHGDYAFLGYAVMCVCLMLIVLVGTVLWCLSSTEGKSRKPYTGKFSI